ncbi:NAD(P)-dependent dehydrogenase, short-chain alcohol dehydrogenase family [Raineyella antarctica]|uniref:NAD(P)-dependent dehydrogenase, short-chain alcohol dehydrogenase family n=1 Tax=Raineyella antarctica TaxID=1577474 RepID=A0A1G6GHZ0_9ACTN|nr:SDR family oxidoreductase [Raineyella antarctica]SDB81570.1 NAD(P)-dependent dehydrogenase, short-chain alcohol dehydrogenase family [Raineyella antarctica]
MPTEELHIVVGATGAVGSAVVARLAGAGRRVLAVARTARALADLSERHPQVHTCVADLSRDAAVDAIRSRIDAPVRLALFAGALGISGSVDQIPLADLAAGFDLKVGGTIRLLRAVRDRLAEPASFVSVAGSLGFEPGPLDAGPGAVNAALANVMRQVSLLYGPRGLAVHTIAPGPLETPRLHALARRRAEEADREPEEVLAEYAAKTSSGHLPSADDVAWLVEMLLAPQARALHGSVLTPDGGVRHTIL